VPGASLTAAAGINAARTVQYGFLWDVDGSVTTLDVPGARLNAATGISAAGQIVGTYIDVAEMHRAFLATPKKL